MDQIYKIGGHCFALPDERLMEVVLFISRLQNLREK